MDDVRPWVGTEGQNIATKKGYMNQGQIRASHPLLISAAYVNCFMYTAHEFFVASGIMCVGSDAANSDALNATVKGIPTGDTDDNNTFQMSTHGSVWNFYPYLSNASTGGILGQTPD